MQWTSGHEQMHSVLHAGMSYRGFDQQIDYHVLPENPRTYIYYVGQTLQIYRSGHGISFGRVQLPRAHDRRVLDRHRTIGEEAQPNAALEERVLFDLVHTTPVREPLLWLLGQQASDEVPRGGADARRVCWEPQRLVDGVEERCPVPRDLEGCGVVQQLIQEHAERPSVHDAIVAIVRRWKGQHGGATNRRR